MSCFLTTATLVRLAANQHRLLLAKALPSSSSCLSATWRPLTSDERRGQRMGNQHVAGGESLSFRKADLAAKIKPYWNQLDYFGTMKHFFCAPKSYLIMGVGGLLPFAVPTLYCVVAGEFHPLLIHMQVVYGATILAFLGGVRWGHLLGKEGISASTRDVGLSTLPSLGAAASLLLPHPWFDMAVMVGLVAAGFYDGLWVAYPVWFRALRLGLTTVAAVSIFIALLGRLILPLSTD